MTRHFHKSLASSTILAFTLLASPMVLIGTETKAQSIDNPSAKRTSEVCFFPQDIEQDGVCYNMAEVCGGKNDSPRCRQAGYHMPDLVTPPVPAREILNGRHGKLDVIQENRDLFRALVDFDSKVAGEVANDLGHDQVPSNGYWPEEMLHVLDLHRDDVETVLDELDRRDRHQTMMERHDKAREDDMARQLPGVEVVDYDKLGAQTEEDPVERVARIVESNQPQPGDEDLVVDFDKYGGLPCLEGDLGCGDTEGDYVEDTYDYDDSLEFESSDDGANPWELSPDELREWVEEDLGSLDEGQEFARMWEETQDGQQYEQAQNDEPLERTAAQTFFGDLDSYSDDYGDAGFQDRAAHESSGGSEGSTDLAGLVEIAKGLAALQTAPNDNRSQNSGNQVPAATRTGDRINAVSSPSNSRVAPRSSTERKDPRNRGTRASLSPRDNPNLSRSANYCFDTGYNEHGNARLYNRCNEAIIVTWYNNNYCKTGCGTGRFRAKSERSDNKEAISGTVRFKACFWRDWVSGTCKPS